MALATLTRSLSREALRAAKPTLSSQIIDRLVQEQSYCLSTRHRYHSAACKSEEEVPRAGFGNYVSSICTDSSRFAYCRQNNRHTVWTRCHRSSCRSEKLCSWHIKRSVPFVRLGLTKKMSGPSFLEYYVEFMMLSRKYFYCEHPFFASSPDSSGNSWVIPKSTFADRAEV